MIVFKRGIIRGASTIFLQQGLTETPRTVRGVFGHLYGELLGVVPALVTAVIVFGIFYFIAWAGMRFINYSAPRFKADASVVLLLSRLFFYGLLTLGIITALGTAGLNVNALRSRTAYAGREARGVGALRGVLHTHPPERGVPSDGQEATQN